MDPLEGAAMRCKAMEGMPERPVPEVLDEQGISALLRECLGLPVCEDDVAQLVTDQSLPEVGRVGNRPLYAAADALLLDAGHVSDIVSGRLEWFEASLPLEAAAARIGWHLRDVLRMGEEGRITVGRFGRYLITDLDRLATENDGEQYITAQAAADVLEIRRTDWKYVEAAGWIQPAAGYEHPVGHHRSVTVPLYRLADVRDLRDMPGVDWESVRGLPNGSPSPLREYASIGPGRATAVKGFAQALADRYEVMVWARTSPLSDGWELEWERGENSPSEEMVAHELANDAAASRYADKVVLRPRWGEVAHHARELLRPAAAVILSVQTDQCGGQPVKVSVIDTATGEVRLDLTVQPTMHITPRAHAAYGNCQAEALPWKKALPRLLAVTKHRIVCAYDDEAQRALIVGATRQAGQEPLHLERQSNWHCLMDMHACWIGSRRWVRLGNGHRVIRTCEAARDLLINMSEGRGTCFTPLPLPPSAPLQGPPAGTILAATALRHIR
ncbi:hypothetical protein ACF1A9_37805 [Streptomyces sp. NPDC014872]|uniref:hypothetical protein n=2 Tax=unclassified Streptomyces TaxID=2593676 RepID=UPI0036FD6408